MYLLARHREFCIQTIDSLVQAAKQTMESFRHGQELHSASSAYALGKAHARRDWANEPSCRDCVTSASRVMAAKQTIARQRDVRADLEQTKTVAINDRNVLIARLRDSNTRIADLERELNVARAANETSGQHIQTLQSELDLERTSCMVVLDVDQPSTSNIRLAQLQGHVSMLAATLRHVLSPRQLKRISAQLDDVQRRMHKLTIEPTTRQTVTLEDGTSMDIDVVDLDVAAMTPLPADDTDV